MTTGMPRAALPHHRRHRHLIITMIIAIFHQIHHHHHHCCQCHGNHCDRCHRFVRSHYLSYRFHTCSMQPAKNGLKTAKCIKNDEDRLNPGRPWGRPGLRRFSLFSIHFRCNPKKIGLNTVRKRKENDEHRLDPGRSSGPARIEAKSSSAGFRLDPGRPWGLARIETVFIVFTTLSVQPEKKNGSKTY